VSAAIQAQLDLESITGEPAPPIEPLDVRPSPADDLAEGRRRRDEGMALTEEADVFGRDKAVIDQAIAHLCEQQVRFSANDLRELLPHVRQPLIGARVRANARAGLMRHVDYTPSTLPSTHGHDIKVWLGVTEDGDA